MNTFRSAIVTSGGLCPGMNTIVYEMTRHMNRRRRPFIGFNYGYKGAYELNYTDLYSYHHAIIRNTAGCVLGTSRVPFDAEVISKQLKELYIDELVVVGGNGTLTGAYELSKVVDDVQIIGIPKTIDNDIMNVDVSFGFYTAMDVAVKAIETAYTEAIAFGCIFVIQLMGNQSGILTKQAVEASGICDLYMIPEHPTHPETLLKHIVNIYEKQGFVVVAVTDGAYEMFEKENGSLIDYISANTQLHTKYMNPGYMLRSTEPNAMDRYYCSQLCLEASAALENGDTDVCVGMANGTISHIPLDTIAHKTKQVLN